jgi:hypothetical protein
MDRRFVPNADGLESRQLLSLLGTNTSFNSSTLSAFGSVQQKALRIDRLPFYIQTLHPGQPLPQDTLTAIQDNLTAIAGKLHPPNPNALVAYNLQLRSTLTDASLHPGAAAGLDANFRRVMRDAGAPEGVISNLSGALKTLAQLDTHSGTPSLLATNDYTLVLEVALGVGKPLAPPLRPELLAADNTGSKTDYVTAVRQPSFVGTYQLDTKIEIVDTHGNVLGIADVLSTGQYTVKFAAPLSVGKHTVYVRGVDPNGAPGHLSKPIVLTITAPPVTHPKGPVKF